MGASYKRFLIGTIISLASITANAQDYDSLRLAQLPSLSMPDRLKSTRLPYKTDNSRNKHFPAMFEQYGYSCHQASSISFGFTYELNAVRNLDAAYPENRLPAFFTWTMMNSAIWDRGISLFESWDMVHAIGCPNWNDYGNYFINETRWMSGYNGYYHGMKNRVEDLYKIDVGSEEGLLIFKNWLYDHLGDYQPGGVANFMLSTLDLDFRTLPEGTEDAGKVIIPKFNYAVGHAMTFVGYNDSVRYDFNDDGRYTNDIDINGDSQVTMADWEIGALICVNTYGTAWGSEGRAYVPYRILPLNPEQGGIWMKSVVVAKPHKSYHPMLTLRSQLRYSSRSKLWITAGVSQDPSAKEPRHILDQPVFHYQGGNQPMQGRGPADPEFIEIGIDATPLLSYVESGKPATFFMIVCEQDPTSSSEGTVEYYSVIEYGNGEREHPGEEGNIPINKPFMALPVIITPTFDGPAISTARLPGAVAGQAFQVQLEAQGGKPPYRWQPVGDNWQETRFDSVFPDASGDKILPAGGSTNDIKVTIPFYFPYKGQYFRDITVTGAGGIIFIPNYLYVPFIFELREKLGLTYGIYPFFSNEFQYPGNDNGVYLETNPDWVKVCWKTTILSGGQYSEVNFAVRLYPSGVIEFYYGDIVNGTSDPWLIGLTGGSRVHSYYPVENASGIASGVNTRYQQPSLPKDISITPEGLLTCNLQPPSTTWTIPVSVEDNQGLMAFRNLTIQTAPLATNETGIVNPAIHIYPNPVNDQAFIEVDSKSDGNIELIIFDLTGKTILRRTYSVKSGKNRCQIGLANTVSPGVYIIQVTGIIVYRSKLCINIPAG